jgi:hypothetical protein
VKSSCHSEKKEIIFKPISLNCGEFEGMLNVESILESVLYATTYTQAERLEPTSKIINEEECNNTKSDTKHYSLKDITEIKLDRLKLKVSSRSELDSIIKEIFPNIKGDLPGAMLDKVDNYSFSLYLHNDNNLADIEKGGDADDVGNTHGLKMIFSKAISQEGYVIDLEYESTLFTNFQNPIEKGFYKDEFGNWHVNQYFIEENIGKVVLRKQKEGEAYYWSVAGGIQELNKSDGHGTLGMFSALGSQVAFHKKMSEVKPGSARLYNNIGQGGSEVAAMIGAKVGKRFTMTQDNNTRAFLETEAQARLTGVNKASYVGIKLAPYVDYQVNTNTAVRAGIGMKTKLYSDKSTQSATFFEVVAAGKTFEAGFKYEMNTDSIPSYQNALPTLVYNDEFRNRYQPPAEDIWTIYVKVKL